jgi:parvulin-like peptidyl-prolyl isomerase
MEEPQMAVNDPAPRSSRLVAWKSRLGILAGGMLIVLVALAVRFYQDASEANAKGPFSKKAPAGQTDAAANPKPADEGAAKQAESESAVPQVVAVVNGQPISRNELANQCLDVFGSEVLANLINKQIIVQHCKAKNITITRAEVDQEIDRIAQRFGLNTERWLQMLKEERGVNPAVYAKDIVWPMLALRKLSMDIEITQAELQEAFEARYGASVRARLIACNTLDKARAVHAEVTANPDEFGTVAKDQSDDPNSASAKGLIQPIRRHIADKNVERIAFSLRPGEISEPIAVGQQYIILKCEQQVPPTDVPLQKVAAQLEQEIRESKQREAANDVFKQLQEQAQIDNLFGNPQPNAEMPGIAATVNGRKITLRELGEACIERHGEGVLEGLITRRLLEQACQQAHVEVTQADVDDEVARAAASVGSIDGSGNPPTVEEWLDVVTKQQGVTVETYIQDAVWPSVALKKLVGESVDVSQEDMQKGFEANYGPRVQCQAIVLNNQRRAQEVWEKARENNTEEFFGDLAEQYSIEESSRALRGEVPPIQRYGGQPVLEEEAFNLKPGELSSVIQVANQYVILRCTEWKKPIGVKFEEVRDLIYQDLHEKKLRLAMADRLDKLTEESQVDNYLAGTVHTPRKAADSAVIPATAVEGAAAASDQPAAEAARPRRQPRATAPAPR